VGGGGRPPPRAKGILAARVLSRRWSVFLVLVALWSWLIWPRFALAIWDDPRAWHGDTPTSFLWVHAVLIVVSLAVGTTVGVLGLRGWRAERGRAARNR
jgi:hypothetical protein